MTRRRENILLAGALGALALAWLVYSVRGDCVVQFAQWPQTVGSGEAYYQADPYAANLIVNWDFEGDGNDRCGSGMDLMLQGAVISNTSINALGRQERALYCDGVDDSAIYWCTKGANDTLSNTIGTVSLWVRPLQYEVNAAWLWFELTNAPKYFVIYNQNTDADSAFFQNVGALNTGKGFLNPFVTNEWHNFVLTFAGTGSGQGYQIYCDGTNVGADTGAGRSYLDYLFTTCAADATLKFNFGARFYGRNSNDPIQEANCFIDNVRIYNTNLPQAGVTWLFDCTGPTNKELRP